MKGNLLLINLFVNCLQAFNGTLVRSAERPVERLFQSLQVLNLTQILLLPYVASFDFDLLRFKID